MRSIIVLGASSWIGHYLISSLKRRFPEHKILGQYRSQKPFHEIETFQASNCDLGAIVGQFESNKPEMIFNLSRGEDGAGFELHKQIIEFVNCYSSYYCYLSSFNAVDGNIETDHTEDESPHSQSEYGKFKAKCEDELVKSCMSFCIFRFAATHGFAPNRESRTESFLKKLKAGEKVVVDRGIYQNRTATTQLADMMAAVAYRKGKGVFNLGSIASSEEILFLRKLAESFGYPSGQVVEGGKSICNAFMVPQKLYQLCGADFKFTEDDVIKEIRKMEGLVKYLNPEVNIN